MNSTKLFTLLIIFGLFMGSCTKDEPIEINHPETLTYNNLYAPSDIRDHATGEILEAKEYIYFDFSTATIGDSNSDWDIAFKGTSIIVNGGISGNSNVSATLVISTFDDLLAVPTDDTFNQDTELGLAITSGSGNGWYNYNPANHLITPIPGRIIVIKTKEGNFAKMEILSYYKDAPSSPNPTTDEQDHFTFIYAYQTDGTRQF